jgi:hypothetical protein
MVLVVDVMATNLIKLGMLALLGRRANRGTGA